MNRKKREEECIKSGNKISMYEKGDYCLSLVNSWIANADLKVEISCAIMSFIFGLISFLAGNVLFKMDRHEAACNCMDVILIILCLIASCFFLVSIYFHLKAITPNLSSTGEKKTCTLFFKDIAEKEMCGFIEDMKKTSDDEFVKELFREVHINSRICTDKMEFFRKALTTGYICIVTSILSCAIYYFVYIA